MRIYVRFFTAVLIACFSAGLSGCSSFHEWPEGGGDDPTLIRTTLRLHIDCTPVTEARTAESVEGCELRYTVDLFAEGSGSQSGRVAREVVTCGEAPGGETTFEVPFDLHAGKYRICVWADYVRKGEKCDLHYNTADLSAVTVIFPYTGCTDVKDAFSGCAEIDLSAYRDRYFAEVDADVALQRACGKFRIRTNDLAELAARHGSRQGTVASLVPPVPATVRVSYSCYFPCGYNVNAGCATGGDFRTDVAFTGTVSELGATSAVLAHDYVFICTEATVVYADIEAYDTAGELISRSSGIRIPLERGQLTTVEGAFLTQNYDNGDIGIDDRFDGEIVVTLPD